MKDHEIAKFVNELTDIARKFATTQQLRSRIAGKVKSTLLKHKKEEDTRIPIELVYRTSEFEVLLRAKSIRIILNDPTKRFSEILHGLTPDLIKILQSSRMSLFSELGRKVKLDFYSYDMDKLVYIEAEKEFKSIIFVWDKKVAEESLKAATSLENKDPKSILE